MQNHALTTGLFFGLCLAGLYGCGQGPAVETPVGEHVGEDHTHEPGPHDGHIIELGTEEYHAELTHDEATHKVGVYLLGSDQKTAKPVQATKVNINVAEDGKPTQFELPAVPQEGESDGTSSYFEIVSEPLCTVVCGESEAKSTQARLSLTIDDKRYVGLIETSAHDHDHGHDHSDAHDHSHAAGDALKWEKELDEQGFQIAVGYHGEKLVAGQDIEPAVKIIRDGQPVADAKVFNALLAENGQKVLVEEVATVYEPPTEDEPAHYAQGSLKVPTGVQKAVLRYRIVLPDGKEHSIDAPVTVQ